MRRCRPCLGTLVEIDADSHAAVEAGFDATARVHRLMSAHEPESELSRLNRGDRISPSADTMEVLLRARFWFEISGGLFDPIVAGAGAIESGAVPLHPSQPKPEGGTTFSALVIEGSLAWLERPACVDLGGIAKGHAVDAAVAAMRSAGATHGLVNAGGDMAAFGRPRMVDVVDPATRSPRVRINLVDRALATSGGLPGVTGLDFAHLPRPSGGFESVTVEARKAIDADALTKIAMLGHPRLGRLLALVDARALALQPGGAAVELGLDEAA